MRRLARFTISLLMVSCFAGVSNATITLVQHIGITYSHVSNPQSLALAGSTTAGNVVVAMCGQFDNGGGNIPVLFAGSAPAANFTEVTTISDSSTFRMSVAVYPNIPGGAMTVSCDSTSASFFTIILAEYSGVDPEFPVDVFNQAYSASGNSKSAGAITTTQAHEAILAFYYDDHIPGANFSATIGSGFTIQEQASTFGSNTQAGFADKIVSTIQTGLNPAWSDGTWAGDGVTLAIVSLREAFSTPPPIAIAQENIGDASGASVAVAFGSNNTAGNLIFVSCYGAQASVPTLSIGDSRNAYTPIGNVNAGSNTAVYWWYAKNIGAGANTVTCSSSLASTSLQLSILEYRGLDPTAPLDQHSAFACTIGNCGTGLLLAQPGAITTTSPNEIILFAYFTQVASGGTSMGPPNYIFRQYAQSGVTLHDFALSDQYLTATGTFNPYAFTHSQAVFYMLSASFVQGPPAPTKIRHETQVVKIPEYHPIESDPILTAYKGHP